MQQLGVENASRFRHSPCANRKVFASWRRVPVQQILVVDDEWELAEVLIYLLHGEGYCMQYASNGEAALQLLSERRIALVLTDYMMPVMNGCELLQHMMRTKNLAAIPVIVTSALPEEVVRDKCAPVQSFLQKPFTASRLVQVVEDAFSH